MTTYSPLILLAALGVLCPAAMAAVDTSQWTCEACPYPKGSSGTVDAGVGAVSDESAKFGDYTGLRRKGAHPILGGTLSYRDAAGYYADLAATELGLDTRSLSAQSGHEGLFALRIGYDELPRTLTDAAVTPFIGSGGTVLTLPAGFPAGGTSTMPLAGAQPIDLGFKRKSFELAGKWIGVANWTYRVSLRRDVRDGTRPISVSSFAAALQAAAPIDQVTDQLEIGVAYAGRGLQAALAYQVSQFSNHAESLTWANPFQPVVAGATRGQLALAPANQLHQITGSAAYEILPNIRASADFAIGRMTQNAAYLAPTLTPALVAIAGALPAASLDGHVDTFNSSVRVTATPMDGVRVNASYMRDVRDNRTTVRAYPLVEADIYVEPAKRSNTPFSLTQDRVKISADYRGPNQLKLSAGIENDNRQRNYHEAVTTREATAWGRIGVRPHEIVSLDFKLTHAERKHSDYGVATWFGSLENPIMRKYNLAERQRDSAGLRADVTASEKIALGVVMDYANDVYGQSLVGLKMGRSVNLGVDGSWAVSEQIQLTAFAQQERIHSRQAGSQSLVAPDWAALNSDRFDILGIGLRFVAIVNKLDVGADLTLARSRSDIGIEAPADALPFPVAKTALGSVKLFATYKLQSELTLNAGLWYESYKTEDWRLDGVLPATVQNLLALGQQAPRYSVTVLRVALRYRF